jgi:hypothetical protein
MRDHWMNVECGREMVCEEGAVAYLSSCSTTYMKRLKKYAKV